MTKIIYCCGMHSSGTSLTANYLQHCGVSMMGTAPIDFLGEGWKAPINSLCIWQWIPLLKNCIDSQHDIHILLIFRHPAEVVKSFMRRKSHKDRAYMANQGGEPFENLEHVWSNYYQSVLDFHNQFNEFAFTIVYSRDMIQKPELLTNALGLQSVPIDGVINKNRFKTEKKMQFRTKRAETIWDKLMEKRVN